MKKMFVLVTLVAVSLAPASCKKKKAPSGPAKGAAPVAKGSTHQVVAAAAAPGSPGVAARYGKKEITLAALDKTIAQELYDLRRQALDKMIARDLVKAAARKAGKSEQDLLRAEVKKRAKKVTEAEMRKAYDAVKSRLRGMSFANAKPILQMQMQRRKQQEAVAAYLEELKKKAGVKVFLDPPRTEVAAVGPSKGPKGAPITIVEFSDFQCPFCSRGRTTVEKVLAAYPGKIRLYFRDFPLDFHNKAQKAAEAAHCADAQGKFWQLHDRMFDAQDKLEVKDLKAAARAAGLDGKKFDACLDSGKMAHKVKEGLEAGKKAGVSGTPAFFINGRLLSGAQPFEKFKEVIDEELARK